MSENVEVIKALIPGPDQDVARMFRELQDPDLAAVREEEVGELFDPDFEAVASYTGDSHYRGPYGLRDFWIDWLEPWATYYIRVEKITEEGNRVFVRSHDRGRRHDSESEVELHGGSVWTFLEGRLVRAEFYPSGEAIDAAWPSE